MGSRRQAREFALQILYQMDIAKSPLPEALETFWQNNPSLEDTRDFAKKLVKGTLHNLAKIDELLAKYTENWDIQRMASIDRNILRSSTYEILFCLDVPVNVVINEAVELAKKFSTAESGKFVNGVLDKLRRERKQKE
ncbi:MAG: transcription antitermination factor NusB [bacterium]